MIQPCHFSKPTYSDNVYTRLMKLKPGEEIEFNPSKGDGADWLRMIWETKRFIDETTDHPLFPYTIQIRGDYGAIRKVNNHTP